MKLKLHRPQRPPGRVKTMTKTHHRFLLAFASAGQSGLTDHELSRNLGAHPDTSRGRRVELTHFGLLERTELTRSTPWQREATVWRITAEGMKQAKTIIRRQNDAV